MVSPGAWGALAPHPSSVLSEAAAFGHRLPYWIQERFAVEVESNEDRVEALARSVLTVADRPPQGVVDVAKLCFEFRGMSVLTPEESGELVGARSTAVDTQQVVLADRTIRWSSSGRGIEGSIAGPLDGVTVAMQSTDTIEPVALDAFGSFFVDQTPKGPFRLLLRVGDDEYATPWER